MLSKYVVKSLKSQIPFFYVWNISKRYLSKLAIEKITPKIYFRFFFFFELKLATEIIQINELNHFYLKNKDGIQTQSYT